MCNYKNFEKINPTRRKIVEEIVRVASECVFIKRVVIFGSSIREDCTDQSDIDICLDINCDKKNKHLYAEIAKICKASGDNCDILLRSSLNERFAKVIETTGIEVYAE